jgi:hypothetical protein
MRVLEARFHPSSKSGRSVVTVGRVVCDQSGVSVERLAIPLRAVEPFDPGRLHGQLEFLVKSAVGDPIRSLLEIRSGFWSFVEVSGREISGGSGAA